MKATNMPTIPEGFIEVDEKQFFKKIGPHNIHPAIINDYDDVYGYTDHWKNQKTGELVGISYGVLKGSYFLKASFLNS